MQKKWTIMIVPNSIDRGFNITLTARLLRVSTLMVCLLLVFSIVFSGVSLHKWRHGYISQIDSLQANMDKRESELVSLSQEFGEILLLEHKLRTIAGLKPRQDMGGRIGMGGLEYPETEETPENIIDLSPILFSLSEDKETRVDGFLKAIVAANDSFSEIHNTFEKEQERLSSIPSINPVYSPDAWISSGYGRRKDPINGASRFHDGVDIVAPRKTPVIAPADGVIIGARWREGLGRMVQIRHGYGYKTTYGHNEKLNVKKGDRVKRGDIIAYLGSSGRSTGPHVHYEISKDGKQVNPYQYVIE